MTLTPLTLTPLTVHGVPPTLGRVAAARPSPTSDFADEVAAEVRNALADVSRAYERAERSLAELGSSAAVADLMVAMLPPPSQWDDVIGPFYGSGQVCRRLGGISRQALADRRARRRILALQTLEGDFVYPLFQFEGAAVLPGLAEVLQLFASDPDDVWTVAAWLVAPQVGLGGDSVVDWVRSDRSIVPVVTVASAFAERLAA